MVQSVVLLCALAVTAYKDWKEQEIYLCIPLTAGVIGLMLHLLYQEPGLLDMLGGIAVGLAVLVAAWASRERIGLGDGIVLMASGIFLGFWGNLQLLLTALLLSGAAALFLLAVKKKERSFRMPFVPFVLAAFLLQQL